MSEAKFTPAPWLVGEYDEHLGYDCMTGGVRVGPVVLDGNAYGQRACHPISDESLARMMADAHLIGAAPRMLEALKTAEALLYGHGKPIDPAITAAIAAATGSPS